MVVEIIVALIAYDLIKLGLKTLLSKPLPTQNGGK